MVGAPRRADVATADRFLRRPGTSSDGVRGCGDVVQIRTLDPPIRA
jgi:hypothetical protein